MEIWWAFLILGAVVGFVAGLLGVGGGAIMVPVLTSLFVTLNFLPEHLLHMALATSMASIILTSIASARTHQKHQAVLWPVVRLMSTGIVLGTFGATFIASLLPTLPLAIFFSCFMAYVALQLLLNIKPKPSRGLPGALGMTATGVGIGGISALVTTATLFEAFIADPPMGRRGQAAVARVAGASILQGTTGAPATAGRRVGGTSALPALPPHRPLVGVDCIRRGVC